MQQTNMLNMQAMMMNPYMQMQMQPGMQQQQVNKNMVQ